MNWLDIIINKPIDELTLKDIFIYCEQTDKEMEFKRLPNGEIRMVIR